MRYVVPSLKDTSHSSQFHGVARSSIDAGRWTIDDGFHQSPDERHGPSQRSTRPPATPRRSVVTRIGRPCSTTTLAGIGDLKRRKTLGGAELLSGLGIRDWGLVNSLGGSNFAIVKAPGR